MRSKMFLGRRALNRSVGFFKDTTSSDDPVKIRDHAILSLLINYGLRRGEVERLTLDDLDWAAETIHVTRPKMRRAQSYPMSVPVGESILHYLHGACPRSRHRALFLTIQAPIRPLSGPSITYIVRTRLTRQGVKLNWRGAHGLGLLGLSARPAHRAPPPKRSR